MNIYLKSLLVVIMAVAGVASTIFVIERVDAGRRAGPRGNDADRAGIINELRGLYNDPGEGAVLVTERGKKLTLNFRETPMRSLRRTFFSRHKDDFARFYAAGFDILTIEAKKDGGEYAVFNYDLSTYR